MSGWFGSRQRQRTTFDPDPPSATERAFEGLALKGGRDSMAFAEALGKFAPGLEAAITRLLGEQATFADAPDTLGLIQGPGRQISGDIRRQFASDFNQIASTLSGTIANAGSNAAALTGVSSPGFQAGINSDLEANLQAQLAQLLLQSPTRLDVGLAVGDAENRRRREITAALSPVGNIFGNLQNTRLGALQNTTQAGLTGRGQDMDFRARMADQTTTMTNQQGLGSNLLTAGLAAGALFGTGGAFPGAFGLFSPTPTLPPVDFSRFTGLGGPQAFGGNYMNPSQGFVRYNPTRDWSGSFSYGGRARRYSE